jgi:hypothetical protein
LEDERREAKVKFANSSERPHTAEKKELSQPDVNAG